jgi:tyrosinase
METFTRKNAWNQNGGFGNPDLLWYARGVQVMQSRELSDPTSWWFFAAIHGQYIIDGDDPGSPVPSGFPNWGDIPGAPSVPSTPLPSQGLISQCWDQCQHFGWFFPPWHRGYLYAIENILREAIQSQGGPADWALPYWNYFGPDNEYQIPPAFSLELFPDGTVNPLYVTARYGPLGDANILVQIPPVSQECQQDTIYTGEEGYYGGGETGFSHFDQKTGDLEQNPHNLVHSQVGGNSQDTPYYGLMGDPGVAALDPIFYLHHCNIDRMWAVWNEAGKNNPNDPNWINGPSATGDRKFFMPNPDGTTSQYTPGMVNSISQLNYTYDDITLGVAPSLISKNALRLRNLALANDDKQVKDMDRNAKIELVGANSKPLALTPSGARTNVKLDSTGWNTVTKSLLTASATNLPDEVFLQLEGVKGTTDSNIYTVSVNHHYAGHISLFGLRIASKKDSQHGGAGLTIRLNITKIIDKLHLSNVIEPDSLDVLIQPSGPISKSGECTIDRVTVYRKGQK